MLGTIKLSKKQNAKLTAADFEVKYSALANGALIFLVVFLALAAAVFPVLYLCDVPDGPPLEAAVAFAYVFGVGAVVAVIFLFAVRRWRIEVSKEKVVYVPLFGKSKVYGWEDFNFVMRSDMYGSSVYKVYAQGQKKKAFSFASVMVGGQLLAGEFHNRGLIRLHR